MTLTEEVRKRMELEKDLASLTATVEEQSVPNNEETAVASTEKSTGGTYFNPDNVSEIGSFANAEDVPKGWIKTKEGEEPQVATLYEEEEGKAQG